MPLTSVITLPEPPKAAFRSNAEKTVVVSTEVEWLPISTAKLGQKMQLHTVYGTATYGELTAKNINGFNAWAPAPKRPQWLLDLMNPSKP